MKRFVWGLVIGAVIAFPLGMNVGKGKPLLSNPFVDKPLSEQIKDTAERVIEETKEKLEGGGSAVEETAEKIKASAEKMMEETRKAVHEATKPEKNGEK